MALALMWFWGAGGAGVERMARRVAAGPGGGKGPCVWVVLGVEQGENEGTERPHAADRALFCPHPRPQQAASTGATALRCARRL